MKKGGDIMKEIKINKDIIYWWLLKSREFLIIGIVNSLMNSFMI